MQKILYCIAIPDNGITYFGDVNDYLEKGWSIVSVTSQNVAKGDGYNNDTRAFGGAFVVIEKT
jgi:hypothetical protein